MASKQFFTRGEGGRCDVAFLHATVHTLNAIALQQPGGESYANMWQKIRAMWKYVYEHYADEYEYFHICGEDVCVVVDNSRAYVSSNNEMTRLQKGPNLFANEEHQKQRWGSVPVDQRPLLLGIPQAGLRKLGCFPSWEQGIH